MRIVISILLFITLFQSATGQVTRRDSILAVLENYYQRNDVKGLDSLSKQAQKKVRLNTASDSLYLAKLIWFEASADNYSDKKTIYQSFNKIIALCPNTHEGLVLKAETILWSAREEVYTGFGIMAYQQSERAIAILENLKKPAPTNLLSELYTTLAYDAFRLGEFEKYNNYLLKAQHLVDSGNITPYNELAFYMFRLSQSTSENQLLYYFNAIRHLKQKKTIPFYEFKYAHVHINMVRFYLEQVKMGDQTASQKAHYYIQTVLSNKSEDRIILYYKKLMWYLKNELLLAENKLELALKSNSELISSSKSDETRMRYNLHQHIRILLKLNRHEEAQAALYKMVSQFHTGSENLKPDYSNFETIKKLEYVSLFLDLSEAFKPYETKSADIKKAITSLNKLSLFQFQNAIENKLTTPKTRALFKQILYNFVGTRHYDTDWGITTSEFLEIAENLKNTLDWQEFLQNRTYAALPFVNKYKYEEAELRNQLITARKKKQDSSILRLELQLEQLEKEFKNTYPSYSKLAFSDFTTTAFQKNMRDDEVVLRYETIKDSLYTSVISKNEVKLLNIGPSESISKSVNTYLNNISERVNTNALAKQLYNQIIPEDVNNYDQIVIVPDAFLNNLPFEALITGRGNYLIEEKAVLYTPYLALLQNDALLESPSQSSKDARITIFTPAYDEEAKNTTEVLVRGNEYRLNGAKKESQLIAEIFDNASFSDYSATKENFKEHAPNAQLLHLSMHANIDPNTPELSYLLFTEGNADNKLYLEELNGTNLKANMAVLSACNTGKVLNAKGGLVSLHRAFTQAGVPTTVASLWSAPDTATQKIMVTFYEELKAGKSKAKALQLAKLQYLKTTEEDMLKEPFYWAGFIINGTNDAVISASGFITNYEVLLLLAISLIVLILLTRKYALKKND
jgi:CHAT domain-containing protein